MQRILTITVVFHWAAIFSTLAFLCILAGSDGASQAFGLMGFSEEAVLPAHLPSFMITALAAIGFSTCSVLFWWTLVATALGDDAAMPGSGDVLSTAFSGATIVLSLVFLYGATQGYDGLFPIVAVHMAALLVSYIAIHAEHLIFAERHGSKEAVTLRLRASEAAHAATLARYSSRLQSILGEGR